MAGDWAGCYSSDKRAGGGGEGDSLYSDELCLRSECFLLLLS